VKEHSFEEIVAIIESRRNSQGPVMRVMQTVQKRYDADYVIPDPSGATDRPSPLLTPTLIELAVEQPALRAASVLPGVFAPQKDPSKMGPGPNGWEYADQRRKAVLASWTSSGMPLLLRRAFKHLRAYDSTAFLVEMNPLTGIPKVKLRDPMSAFPDPRAPEDLALPLNCGFVHGVSGGVLRKQYPRSREELGGPIPADGRGATDDLWEVVEWIDEMHIVIGILGPRIPLVGGASHQGPVVTSIELARYDNLARCCTVVCPKTLSLSQVASKIAKIIGHVDLAGQLIALEIAAIQKSIYPDRYIIGDDLKAPYLVDGNWHEGSTGRVNLIANAKSIGELRAEPSMNAARIRDELQRNAERSGGILPQQSGENVGGMRTGRGLDTLGAWAVDPAIQEMQEIMAAALMPVNRAILKTYLGYDPDKKFQVLFTTGGTGGYTDFTPSKEIEEAQDTVVSYAIAGADKSQTTVTLAQLNGTGLQSKKSSRRKHPDIDDAEYEERQIRVEQAEEAVHATVLSRSQQPDSPNALSTVDVGKYAKYVAEGMMPWDAIKKVDDERSALQAQAAQGELTGPEAQPGIGGMLEQAGAPAPPEEIPPSIDQPPEALHNFQLLHGAMRQTSRA
jgi:hypothetical protein